ncbi:MAG TPA: hypothetical protein VL576_01615 [Candidatus Paceibacterota bacterium]|jgi:hypothetical protein|nr:hypothetical protein [Candidatus Paceibacterota bacterium]
MEDHTNRALIIVMIILLILILILYFLPHGIYFTSPSVTVERRVPAHPTYVQTHVYTTSSPSTTYQEQYYTTTTTQNTTTAQ